MQIQPGSVADRTKKIKRGDELIQVIIFIIIIILFIYLFIYLF